MARAGLGLSQAELAKAAGVALGTLASFEKEARRPYERTLRDIRAALECAGAEFGSGSVRLTKREVK